MKTTLTLLIISIFSSISFSQVYGEIFMDKRKIVKDIDYTISYSKAGTIVFDIAVNMEGKITSCELNKSKSTITTTAAMMKAKNLIIMGLVFERGYTWPKFHRGYVQIKTVQGKATKSEDKFAPPPH
jgi:hypothetical protein